LDLWDGGTLLPGAFHLANPRTGNGHDPKANSIAFWDVIANAFHEKEGYGISFGDSEDGVYSINEFYSWTDEMQEENPSPQDKSDEDDSEGEESRKEKVQREVDNQRKKRKRYSASTAASEISTGLMYLGDSLKEGLRCRAQPADTTTNDLLEKMICGQAELTNVLKVLAQTLASSAARVPAPDALASAPASAPAASPQPYE
jgi:hypothetical protein